MAGMIESQVSARSSQKSCEPESSVSASQSLLEEAGPEPLSWHPQASSPRASEPFSSLDLSHGSPVALEYLPFFRTYGNLLAVEELAPRPEVSRDQGGDQNIRDVLFPKDSEPPSGFFPLYRSKEECFPRLALPGSSCGVSQDPCTRKEALAGRLCRVTVSGGAQPPRQAQASPLGPHARHPAPPSCGSQQGAATTATRPPLPPGAVPLVPGGSCLTTEPRRRSCTPVPGRPPLRRGARSPGDRCPQPLWTERQPVAAGAAEEWAPAPAHWQEPRPPEATPQPQVLPGPS
ncbi:uncharacterized protein LOC144235377 isoform X1 [Crocuta crocuta]